jgi:hypothetical protein
MSGWLAKASGALRGDAPETPQPFEVLCECGMRHSGVRRRKPQRIVCRSCGTALFILPRDPYPIPSAPAPKRKKKRKRGRRQAAPRVPVRKRLQEAGGEAAHKAAAGVKRASSRAAQGAAAVGVGIWTHLAAYVCGFIGMWTPFRLVAAAIVLFALATFAWTFRSRTQEQAIVDLKAADEAARVALVAQNFPAAQTELSRAVAALDALDRHQDPLAREIRQLYRETTVLQQISAYSPFEIATEAEEFVAQGSRAAWEQRFTERYARVWIVLEADARRTGSSPDGGQYVFEFPFYALGNARRGLRIAGTLPALDSLSPSSDPGKVVLAGQLAACTLSADGRVWDLRLDAATAFLWANVDSYQALGFTFDDADSEQRLRETLRKQARTLGLTP